MRSLWVAAFAFFYVGCSSTHSGSSAASPEQMGSSTAKGLAIPIEKLAVPYCPECEMSFHRFAIQDTLTYEGKLYGFCSSACKASFTQRMGSR